MDVIRDGRCFPRNYQRINKRPIGRMTWCTPSFPVQMGVVTVQVYLLWSDEIPDLWEELDSEFLLELKRKWTDNQERMKRSSFSHLEVSEVHI